MKGEGLNNGKRYEVIYADPPWSYRNGGRGAAKNHYSTMTPTEIKELPVADIAAENCTLFMWATFPNLKQALETMDAWGFQYKTNAFTWVKQNRGGGAACSGALASGRAAMQKYACWASVGSHTGSARPCIAS